MNIIKNNIARIRSEIEEIRERAGIPYSVKLCAATKTRTIEEIDEAVRNGVDCIGENKVQEARDKYPLLTVDSAERHFIGHLQTNKVKYCCDLFDCIQSIDSIQVLDELDKYAGRSGKKMKCFLEINISGENSKFGLNPDYVTDCIAHFAKTPHVIMAGFMTMLAFADNEMQLRKHAENMRRLFVDMQRFNGGNIAIAELSMGMSQDYKLCIESGSTMIRIGTGIFGERQV